MPLLKLCGVSEIQENSLRRFEINGLEILLARHQDQFYALSERCTHRGGPLSEGTLENGVVTCPLHFGQFDIKTGTVQGPPPSEPLRSYEVKVENGAVYLAT